jgi:hypothetical protein
MPSSQVAAVRADVVRLFGDVDDEEISEVLALSPTISELAEASAWLDGQGDVMDRKGRPQTPRIAAILDIVDREEDEPSYLR